MIQNTSSSVVVNKMSSLAPAANLLCCVRGTIISTFNCILLPCLSASYRTSWRQFTVALVGTTGAVNSTCTEQTQILEPLSTGGGISLWLEHQDRISALMLLEKLSCTWLTALYSPFLFQTWDYQVSVHDLSLLLFGLHDWCQEGTPHSDVGVWKYANSPCSDFNESSPDAESLLLRLIASPHCGI